MPDATLQEVRVSLLDWYRSAQRDLPWRRSRDPYCIWISEIMLQQTRVAAVVPYYERLLERFPDVRALAEAPEAEVLACWSGLGYYSRARNLQKAARLIVQRGTFPQDYEGLRALPGIGDYTAAAVASIAFGLSRAVLDGNVMRVLARMLREAGDVRKPATRKRLQEAADRLLDASDPGSFNQAIMELGATVCLPREPQCLVCPLRAHCEAQSSGRQQEFPVKGRGREPVRLEETLLIIRRGESVLLWQRQQGTRMAGFWELPHAEEIPNARRGQPLGSFRHSIMHQNFTFSVESATLKGAPDGFSWVPLSDFRDLPLSTTARKALKLLAAETKN
jgi:A/G-specific adenine glycosylase